MISLLCPTRDRPVQFKRMCESAHDTSKDIEILSATNGGEKYAQFEAPLDTPTVFTWNALADMSKGDIIMLCADDVIFSTPGWDEILTEHYKALENKTHVYAFQDSRDYDGTPHPFVTREYMDHMGYFLPPIFLHWYVDSWTVAIGKANNCFTHMREISLVHEKPSDKGNVDETHRRIRRNGWLERDRHVNKTCQHLLELEKKRLAEALSK